MKNLFLTIFAALILFVPAFAQNAAQTIAADEIVKQVEAGKSVSYANITVTGNFDLSRLSQRTNDATYPENGKTARVYSAKITQPVEFKNVRFKGKVIFFRREITRKEIGEYRLVFSDAVKFENCIFADTADFELTNFDSTVSFENSVFKAKPTFVRIGLEKMPNFTKTVFENGSVFKNFQNDAEQNFTAANLENFYRNYIASR